MNQWTFYLTVPLAALSAFGQAQLFRSATIGTRQILPYFGWGGDKTLPTITLLITMTAGTMFAVWLGELISEQGIGNGLSLIIFGGIVARVPASFRNIWESDGVIGVLVYLVILVGTILFIVFVQDGERRIKVQYGKRVRGMKQYAGGSTYIPLKINGANVVPIIFASTLLLLPRQIVYFFPDVRWLQQAATSLQRGPVSWALEFMLIVFFTYFYTALVFNPIDLADNLRKSGGFIPGVRPGTATVRYIENVLNRITLPGALFLAVIAVVPSMLFTVTNNQLVEQFGGTSILIMVGVALETMTQVESQLKMRHYDGFFQ